MKELTLQQTEQVSGGQLPSVSHIVGGTISSSAGSVIAYATAVKIFGEAPIVAGIAMPVLPACIWFGGMIGYGIFSALETLNNIRIATAQPD